MKVYGDEDSETILLGSGSTKGPVLDALSILGERGVNLGFLQVLYLEPFPAKRISKAIGSKKTIDVENNATGQLASIVREKLGLQVDGRILKYDGRPFEPVELAKQIEEVL